HIHEYSNLPAACGRVALELMIRRGLNCSPKLMPVGIESLTPCAAGNFLRAPRIDHKLDEHHSFGIEEEENLIQPIHDLRGFIGARRFEVAVFHKAEWFRIDEKADETFGCSD